MEEVTDSLTVDESRISRFYLLPKIHKGLSSVKGHPIIPNCCSIAEHILEYLDHQLNPLISFTRSYVKDTNHLLARLSKLGIILDGVFLCTVDVMVLYPSIPHEEGLEAIREALG